MQVPIGGVEHFDANQDATQAGVCSAATDSGALGLALSATDRSVRTLVPPLGLK